MNIKMLKCLVGLADKKVDVVNTDDFFKNFPKTNSNLRDLYALKNLGYVSILGSDDDIDAIGVNQSAIGYFN